MKRRWRIIWLENHNTVVKSVVVQTKGPPDCQDQKKAIKQQRSQVAFKQCVFSVICRQSSYSMASIIPLTYVVRTNGAKTCVWIWTRDSLVSALNLFSTLGEVMHDLYFTTQRESTAEKQKRDSCTMLAKQLTG